MKFLIDHNGHYDCELLLDMISAKKKIKVSRATAYSNTAGSSNIKIPVPYSLRYIKTGKRFMVEPDENNKTNDE